MWHEQLSKKQVLLVEKYYQQIKESGKLFVPKSKFKRLANDKYIRWKLRENID